MHKLVDNNIRHHLDSFPKLLSVPIRTHKKNPKIYIKRHLRSPHKNTVPNSCQLRNISEENILTGMTIYSPVAQFSSTKLKHQSLKYKKHANYIKFKKSASYRERNRTFKCLTHTQSLTHRCSSIIQRYNSQHNVHRSDGFEDVLQF